MKKIIITGLMVLSFSCLLQGESKGQCSVCTKSAQQLGEKPAKALNGAIIYLMMAPFAIAGFIGYRWWKNNRD